MSGEPQQGRMEVGRRRPDTLTWLVVLAYVIVRCMGWVLSLPTIVGPDSHSYLPGPGLGAPDNWYVGFEKVSWTGDGAIRPWTVALPYAVLLTDYFRSIFQLAVSIGAFLFLSGVLVTVVRPRALGRALALIVLAISCATLVAGWDLLMNRESLSISLSVIFIAIALLATHRRSYVLVMVVMMTGLLVLLTRPTLAPLVGLVVIVLLVDRVLRSVRARRANAESLRAGTVLRGLAALALAGVMLVYPLVYSLRLDASWQGWYGQTMSETQFGYVVSDYNPQVGTLITALGGQVPQCLLDELPVFTGDYVGAPWGFAARMREECPGFQDWYDANWPSWYYDFIVRHPAYGARVGLAGFRVAVQPWEPTSGMSALPGPARDAVFPITAGDGLATYDPLWFYWSIVLASALVGVVRLRTRSWAFVRRHATMIGVLVAAVVGSLATILLNLLLVPSYPLETNRINVVPTLTLRVIGTLIAVLVVWTLVRETQSLRNRRRPPQADS